MRREGYETWARRITVELQRTSGVWNGGSVGLRPGASRPREEYDGKEGLGKGSGNVPANLEVFCKSVGNHKPQSAEPVGMVPLKGFIKVLTVKPYHASLDHGL